METATFVQKATRRGIRFEADGASLAIFSETILTPNEIRAIDELEAELLAWLKMREVPPALDEPLIAPALAEIREKILFLKDIGTPSSTRFIATLLRLTDGLFETQKRIEEGLRLGVWKTSEGVDEAGNPVYELLST